MTHIRKHNDFQIFARSWKDKKGNWKKEGKGRKTVITYADTPEEAQRICREFNENRTQAQIDRSYAYEYTSIY